MISQFQSITKLTTPILDGSIQRFGDKKQNWYVGHSWDYLNKNFQIIKIGSWNNSIPETTLKSWTHDTETKAFRKKFTDIQREADAKLKVEKYEKHQACKMKWEPIFQAAKTSDHEYLDHKSITAFNSRVDFNGVLLIPAYNQNGFVGVQRIFLDPETKQFAKKFAYGIEIDGAFCPLSKFKDAEFCYLSEGFATAATIQMAFPDIPSICAFNAGNLSKCVNTVRFINPKIKIIIAADKDLSHKGENEAKKCVKSFSDVIYKLPVTDNDNWTDFNDIHCFINLETVKEQLEIDDSDFCVVTPLGYNDNTYFYTSTKHKQVMAIGPNSHNDKNLFSLASKKYWAKKYGITDEETKQLTIPWSDIISDLMESCHDLKVFNSSKVRGTGVWKDESGYVLNDGETVLNKPKETEFFYQISKKVTYNLEEEMTDEECQHIVSSLYNLKYKNQKDYVYLASFVAQAQIFSVLPWRFHVWLTGERGTGKSSILKWINGLMTNSLSTNDSTRAGLTQELRCDARVTIYDEAEASSEKMEGVLDLARQMSSIGDFKTLRGTSGGKVVSNNTNTIFFMGSIQTANFQGADKSRFFVVEMDSIKDQPHETYQAIDHNFKELSKMKHKLFTRCFNHIDTILTNFENIRMTLKEMKIESRLADQIGMSLACFSIMQTTQALGKEEIQNLIKFIDINNTEYMEGNKGSDQGDLLDEIMDIVANRDNMTVGIILEKIESGSISDTEFLDRDLASLGLKYEKGGHIYVSNNSLLSLKLRKYANYLMILRRHKNFIQYVSSRINNKPTKCCKIKVF